MFGEAMPTYRGALLRGASTSPLSLLFAERLLVPAAVLPASTTPPERWFGRGPTELSGHVFLDGSWHDQHLPAHAQAAGWAVVSFCPRTLRVLSVFVGVLAETLVDIDAAELTAFLRGLQHATPGATFYTDSDFVFVWGPRPRT